MKRASVVLAVSLVSIALSTVAHFNRRAHDAEVRAVLAERRAVSAEARADACLRERAP